MPLCQGFIGGAAVADQTFTLPEFVPALKAATIVNIVYKRYFKTPSSQTTFHLWTLYNQEDATGPIGIALEKANEDQLQEAIEILEQAASKPNRGDLARVIASDLKNQLKANKPAGPASIKG